MDSTVGVAYVTGATQSAEYQRLAVIESMYRGTAAMPEGPFTGTRKVLSTIFTAAPAVIGTLMSIAQRLHTLAG